MLAGRSQPKFLSRLLRSAAAASANCGAWRRQSRRPCRLPRGNKPKSRRLPRATGAPLGRGPLTLQRLPSSKSGPSTPNRLLGDRLRQHPKSRAWDAERPCDIPLPVRLAHGFVAAFAFCLLLQAIMQAPDFWRLQTLNQVVCGTLLSGAAIAGVLGLHRSPLICKACAVTGWWVGLLSLLLDHALNPVPIIGLAVFFTAGSAADVLTDSQQSRAERRDDGSGKTVVRELAFRRWGPGL